MGVTVKIGGVFFALLIVCQAAIENNVAPNPVAVFHGFGDACRNPGMKVFTKTLSTGLNGTYVRCIEIGDGAVASILMPFEKQLTYACSKLSADPGFAGKTINVVGLSQGALIARGIVELCDLSGGKVARLISIGGPQMGVATIPQCHKGFICGILNGIVDEFVYTSKIQSSVGPAGYFRNPRNYKEYVSHSTYLPQVNNENQINETAKARFAALEKVQLTMFSQDTVIDPKQTAWFGFYAKDGKTIVDMTSQQVYKDNLFGLKDLHEAGKVEFVEINGDHLQFSNEDIQTYFIPALL